jgi:putative Mn2+ efflux pump MntP
MNSRAIRPTGRFTIGLVALIILALSAKGFYIADSDQSISVRVTYGLGGIILCVIGLALVYALVRLGFRSFHRRHKGN